MLGRLALAVALMGSCCLQDAGAALVFSNFNGEHVFHGAAGSPTFSLAATSDIGGVDIYVQSANNVFTNSGTVHFFNQTTNVTTDFFVTLSGTSHQYGVNDFDEQLSFSGLTTLSAGSYVVTTDAALAAEWAYNPTSGNKGFLAVTVPEPTSLALVGLALAGLGTIRRRKA